MPVILICRLCGGRVTSAGLIPSQCPTCGKETTWDTPWVVISMFAVDGWHLSRNDQQLLRAMRIDPT